MPAFKPKNIKKFNMPKKNITTLDSKHKEIIDEINVNKQDLLPLLQKEKKEIHLQLKNNTLSVDDRLELQDSLIVTK